MFSKYDVIVVGAGHAGCEAAHAAATMGSSVLLVTMNMTTIAQMSCNPAMGGVAKGQIVRELDALGGMSGIIADRSTIQFRMLNKSKGPAMWSPRTQNDRMLFSLYWREALEQNPNIDFWQDTVKEIIVEGDAVKGVATTMGHLIYAEAVILTNGTFLNGQIHIGEKNFSGGRVAERASQGITEQLISIGFESGRMKTGTPPRVDGRSLDYSKMEEQPGDDNPGSFSFLPTPILADQLSCWITYTNPIVHEILREGFDRSPMFQGRIRGLGPRYCPSVEDKINRFSERDRHQIFVEPEGRQTVEIYVNGFSTSLPEEIQFRALRQIPGFERVKMFRPGYAIEYDFFQPTQLKSTLETKAIHKLFFAGQINGTTGYEEAAAQGLIAGINAALLIENKGPFVLSRSEAYIGVLIDDLINKGTEEPYRMFTSRAEYRILLRQDNADIRLTEKAYHIGLASQARYDNLHEKRRQIAELSHSFDQLKIEPEAINATLAALGTSPLEEKTTLSSLLKRPQINLDNLEETVLPPHLRAYSREVKQQAEIQLKYQTYIEREKLAVEKLAQLEAYEIRDEFDYDRVNALSSEGREKLKKVRPNTIGQAARISGVSPADISILTVYMGK